jgi:hypothetical protein
MGAIRLIGSSLLAAVVMFFWGFVFWGGVLPTYTWLFERPENEDAVLTTLKGSMPQPGFYLLPDPGKPAATGENAEEVKAAMTKKQAEGPLVCVIYQPKGVVMDEMGLTMGIGFAHYFVCALMAGGLLMLAAPSLPSYASRVMFVASLAVFAVVMLSFADVIWFHHPMKYHLGSAVYPIVAWLLAGLVLGALIRHKPAVVAASSTIGHHFPESR